MSARILKFAPRGTVQAERPELPAPPTLLKRRFFQGALSTCEFIGTKESLVAWGIALEGEFPEGRKRKQYNRGDRPTVTRFHDCSTPHRFTVAYHFGGNDAHQRKVMQSKIEELLALSSKLEEEAERALSGLFALRQRLFWPSGRGALDFDQSQIEAFDSLVDGIHKVVAATMLRNQQTA